MTMAEIREKAKGMGIKKTVGIKKADLIREIQAKEGNSPCFGTATSFCDQRDCCFREDCLQV
ncbi:MAG: hypothetical protein HW415_1264 [Deltaproteobacteria bacterium]|nr:hypothetical protein [Deltaproteobacteria bacterium]